MRSTLKTLSVAAVFLLFFPLEFQARGEGSGSGALFKVSVRISGDPEITNVVKSFIGRELRALRDVQVTNDQPDWVFHVITVEVKLKENVKTGYGISAIILEPFQSDVLTPLLDKRYVDRGHTLTADLYSVKKHMINIGSKEDIKNICVKMVADLDSEFLEIKRKK